MRRYSIKFVRVKISLGQAIGGKDLANVAEMISYEKVAENSKNATGRC